MQREEKHKLADDHLLTDPEIKQEAEKLKRQGFDIACHFLFEEANLIPSFLNSITEGRCVYLSNNILILSCQQSSFQVTGGHFSVVNFPCSFPLLCCELVMVGKLETVASSLIQLQKGMGTGEQSQSLDLYDLSHTRRSLYLQE